MQNVRKGEELQEKALKAFLYKENLIQSENVDWQVDQYTHGYSNLTYLITIESNEYVLRRPPFGAIKRGHDMGREFKVQSNIAKAFTKVPKMHAYTEDESIIGCPFYIMEKVDGIILNYKEAKQRAIPEADFKIIADSWLDTFVELHAVDYNSIGLAELGKPEGYVSRQVRNWSKQYLNAATSDVPAAAKVMEWMEEHQPKQYEHRLIHNDFKYDNVVFKDTTWKEINAVLDWEMTTLGDPLMDLGTSLGYWTMSSDHPAVQQGIPSPTLFSGNPGRNEIVQRYAEKSGRAVDHLIFYYAFGLFKIAVIAQQIFYRYNKGLTTDPRFAELDKAAALLCNLAWKAIQTKKIE
ncbi:phosphotransferase family protein [Aquimarina brevivitae]|uniref:Aminoglycoside phosphotransferase (APT) family kinase protein n=1 Tax=Aquimarina brevivitae TaxID=323412 RepID=A0A4Q7NTM1_9FLAO|nr:phosphotransferase family protein [Aquimarina brevivitae]RZS90467.1 aminoglycoside phosphotransferase (APT) family kinase protein [Aquimarina brevivitae]